MATEKINIEVRALQKGMFVCELDRPWHETPFPLQGFYVRTQEDINALIPFCRNVFIDTERTREAGVNTKEIVTPSTSESPKVGGRSNQRKHEHRQQAGKSAKQLNLPPIAIKKPCVYEVEASIYKEASKASKLYSNVNLAMKNVFDTVRKGGEVDIPETSRMAESLVDSVVRNPDALVWLSKMSDQDVYAYQHVVRSSVWALVLGRHLGLDRPLLKTLAMGVLLSHLGKMNIAPELLQKASTLTRDELVAYQAYVMESVHILRGIDGIGEGVIAIAEFHQERHNGSGFPKGITGERIPLLAKIAGLVEHYQALITPRDESFGCSPREAVAKLYESRNIEFQQDLVEKFIEAVGVYPTGTLVQLNNQEVGIVTGHNQDRRLQPTLIVVLDAEKQPLRSAKVIDLKEWNRGKEDENCLFIQESLPTGTFGIDENAYLQTGAKSKWSLKHIRTSLMH